MQENGTKVKEVITKGSVITKRLKQTMVPDNDHAVLRQGDNKTDGAIITFNDILELKKIQLELNNSNKDLLPINANLDNFMLIASNRFLRQLSFTKKPLTPKS